MFSTKAASAGDGARAGKQSLVLRIGARGVLGRGCWFGGVRMPLVAVVTRSGVPTI